MAETGTPAFPLGWTNSLAGGTHFPQPLMWEDKEMAWGSVLGVFEASHES